MLIKEPRKDDYSVGENYWPGIHLTVKETIMTIDGKVTKFCMIDYNDGSNADIMLNMIKETKKADYTVGENVLARYPSYSCEHKGLV